MGLVSLLFSFHGRINRSQYWSGTLGLNGANFVFFMMTSFSQASSAMMFKSNPAAGVSHALGMLGLILLVNGLITYCSLAIQVKRFHDRGRSGWLTVIPFVLMIWLVSAIFGVVFSAAKDHMQPEQVLAAVQAPFLLLMLVGLAFLIDLGCLPGEDHPNKHGDPPGPSGGGYAPAPVSPKAPSGAASSLFSAQAAMDRAIAEKPRASAPAQQPMRPAPVAPVAPRSPGGSFGRRAPS